MMANIVTFDHLDHVYCGMPLHHDAAIGHVWQYSNEAPRLSGQTSIFWWCFLCIKSLGN